MDAFDSDRTRSAPAVPLAEVLERLSAELAELSDCTSGLENLVGELLKRTGLPRESFAQQDLQSVDRLMQRLEALVQLIGALHAAVPNDWTLAEGWCRNTALSHQAQRLCQGRAVFERESETTAGECEWF